MIDESLYDGSRYGGYPVLDLHNGEDGDQGDGGIQEDAVSTSIIFTQAPVKEEHKVIEMQSLTWCLFMFAL